MMTRLANYLNAPEEALQMTKTGIYTLFVFLGIDHDIVGVLGILMVIDTGLGVIKALRLSDKVTFKKMMWGMVTKVSVLIIPMILALVAKGIDLDFRWFVVAVINVLIVAEAFSCITNILSIKSKERIENADYITMVLHAIRKGLSSLIQRFIGDIENPKK